MLRAFRMASLEANVGERSDEVYLPTKDGVGIACPMNYKMPTRRGTHRVTCLSPLRTRPAGERKSTRERRRARTPCPRRRAATTLCSTWSAPPPTTS